MWWSLAASAVIGYLVGSVQFGLIIGRLTRGIDIREYGSGATGATNVIRTSGAKAGVLVILLDIAKGIAPVYIGFALARAAGVDTHDDRAWAAAAGGLGAVVGHVWPLYAGFRGGRAVATGFGAALAMNPVAAAALIPVAALVVGTVRIMSVMSITMSPLLALVFVALAIAGVSPWAYAAYAVPTAALIVWKHRGNIQRLRAGTEPKIGKGGERRADATGTGNAAASTR
ncbi:MAG TPA: glycerol-3-phosphate 1-O-acyltransferase PlsY [Dehalococcoidia bacterium]|nr:glycerol-3-phosphate 1-O-acyltransferase PlsY [Dehalococcoidia bacterium]